jgi:hypothetical protein
MTGEELMVELQRMTPEQRKQRVDIEGCDCWGQAEMVLFDKSDDSISITRKLDQSCMTRP